MNISKKAQIRLSLARQRSLNRSKLMLSRLAAEIGCSLEPNKHQSIASKKTI